MYICPDIWEELRDNDVSDDNRNGGGNGGFMGIDSDVQ